MPWLALLRVLGPILAVLAVVGGLIGLGYSSGRAKVQRAWDADKAAQLAAQQRDALRRQETNHGIGIDYYKQAQAAAVAAALARADADSVRSELAARAADPGPGFGPAEAAATARSLGECIGEYQEVASRHDQLSGQVTGLQAYVAGVCLSGATAQTPPASQPGAPP